MQPDSGSKPTSGRDGLTQFPRDPLDDAQELCFDAWESGNPRERVRLAKKALELSPECADAYVILANEAKSPRRRVELYGKGVAAGERALGPRTFEHEVGHFWGLHGTRPYMRARFGLAQALWEVGRREEAISHCSEMLRLNPRDNQGVRYVLIRYLLEEGRDSDAVDIMDFYEGDASADWVYTQLLITLRKEGDSEKARAHQAHAHRSRLCGLLRTKRISAPLSPPANPHHCRTAGRKETRIPVRRSRPRRNLRQSGAEVENTTGGAVLTGTRTGRRSDHSNER